ncbi:putative phage abortive infection protein [Lactococcus lactis]|jgi:hypothetical protein|uniref:Phage abortive infection protein n=3 Tax=Lactococcus lactis TaxID=1358 RepID=A0A1V0P1B6_LACLL|nr:putative phage abortive infection protein [Lactococcus lactis]ARE20551.1 putative phage abortive infection protein [Lactococcus lactis subsp. lactis]MDH8062817.1 putative phage abortive infection protein [Lactococcus lactis subsp. lactis]MDN6820668.1 putative phage abortive infection protein [Lactococcus lactis]WBM78310.1 putative phage abortive infection protein [Lactococcus lactis]WSP32760.1 putative phage abortive infection protein [Lactococcus lactis subsp. lactis]
MDILFLAQNFTSEFSDSELLSFAGDILSGLIGLLGAGLGVYGAYYVMQKQLKAENEQYRKDKIDNTFFNLLGLFQNVQKDLDKDYIIDCIEKDRNSIRNDKHEEYMNSKFSKQKEQIIKDLEGFNNEKNGNYRDAYNSLLEDINKKDLFYLINNIPTDSYLLSKSNSFKKYKEDMEGLKKEFEDEKLICKYEIKESEIKGIIKKVFFNPENDSGNYFRTLYRCLKYIMDSDLKMEDKKFYSGVLRGVLSSKEMLVVFYNCMYFEKGEKFKELLEKEENGKRIDFFGDKNDLENLSEGNDLPFFSKEDLLFSETDMQKLEELIKGN